MAWPDTSADGLFPMDTWFPTFRNLMFPGGPFGNWWPPYTTAAQRQSLLRLIAVAIEENLPLPPLIEHWAADESGVQCRRLRRLARLLREGRPVPVAVEEVPGVLSDEDLLALRFDSQSGTRTAAIREAIAESKLGPTRGAQRLRRALVYCCVIMPLGLIVIAFCRLKIVPVLQRVFSEFGLELPPWLRRSIAWQDVLSDVWWIVALVVIAGAWWLLATRHGRRLRQALLSRLFRPWRELRSADVLQHLGVAANAGRPIPGALSTLARYHFDPGIRRDLLFVRNEVEQGAEVWQSMTDARLLTPPEAHLLRTAERAGNRPWVLRQLVGVKRRRTTRALDRAAEFVLPAIVLLMAGLVLFQAITILDPLRRLVEGLL